MKILHVVPAITVGYGGPVTTMINIIGIWQRLGVASHVLAINRAGRSMDGIKDMTLVDASFPSRFSASRAAARWFSENAQSFSLVIFHSSWSLINLQIASIAFSKKIPYAVIAHGSLDPFDLQKKSIWKRLVGPLIIKPYLRYAKAVVCSTNLEAERLETYGAKPEIIVLPWAVQKLEVSQSRPQMRLKYGLSEHDFVILFLGRIDYKKGFPVLIPAFSKLVRTGINTKLVIVGPDSGGYLLKVKEMIDHNGVGGSVVFVPLVVGAEKVSLMAAADCFALVSLNENFGNTVVEAIQVGTPVVVSDNVYISDSIEKAGAGIVIHYNVDETFNALVKLADDRALRKSMSDAALSLGATFEPTALQDRYQIVLRRLHQT